MKLVRSYLLFTPLLYRILMLLIMPVAVLIFAIFFCVDAILATILSAMILCCVEIIADYWVFGGICTKEFPGLEFLKSSVRGRKIFRSAVTGDCVRKLIWSLVLVAGPAVMMVLFGDSEDAGIGSAMQIVASLASGLLAYSTIQLFQFIARHLINFALSMLMAYVSATAGTLLAVAAVVWSPVGMLLIGVVFSILLTAFTIWDLNRRMEGSYYDRTM